MRERRRSLPGTLASRALRHSACRSMRSLTGERGSVIVYRREKKSRLGRTASPVIYVVELLRVRPYYPHTPLQGSSVPKKSALTPSKCPTRTPCGVNAPDALPSDAPWTEIWPPNLSLPWLVKVEPGNPVDGPSRRKP